MHLAAAQVDEAVAAVNAVLADSPHTELALRDGRLQATRPRRASAMTAARSGSKMKPEQCAAQIVAAIERDDTEANVGMVKLLKLVHSMSPRLAEAIMIRF